MIEVYPQGENSMPTDVDINQAAYLRLKPEIDSKYPKNWFVGIDDGQVVADAESYEALQPKLKEIGRTSRSVLVVQAGEDSDFLWIL
jgi:hypothetical protein